MNPAGVPKGLEGTALPFRYNHIEELEEIVKENGSELAAIVMEPIRSDQPQEGFLQKVREIADSIGAIMIIDEISAGFRLNSGGAHLILDLTPDIAVFSKAIGNGYSIGTIIGNSDVMSSAQASFISSTNWTEQVGFAAALATIRKHIDCDASKHLCKIGEMIQGGWNRIAEKHSVKIHTGGIYSLSHFVFDYYTAQELKAYFVQEMLKSGFLASTSFYSMFTHSQRDVEQYIVATDSIFKQISTNIGSISKILEGEPSVTGFKRLI